jgi:hypothetical protein
MVRLFDQLYISAPGYFLNALLQFGWLPGVAWVRFDEDPGRTQLPPRKNKISASARKQNPA